MNFTAQFCKKRTLIDNFGEDTGLVAISVVRCKQCNKFSNINKWFNLWSCPHCQAPFYEHY